MACCLTALGDYQNRYSLITTKAAPSQYQNNDPVHRCIYESLGLNELRILKLLLCPTLNKVFLLLLLLTSYAGDGIFQLWGWTDNMYCCSKVNFIYLGQAIIQDMIQNVNISFNL